MTARRPLLAGLLLVLASCSTPSPSPSADPTSPSAEATATATSAPSEEATASPTTASSASPSASTGGGFAIPANAEADALFIDRDTCENLDDGYRLAFPDAWFTNTAVGDVPACSWFSPTFYEVADQSETPDEIAITIALVDGSYGTTEEVLSNEDVVVGGTQVAHRMEVRGAQVEPPEWRQFAYVIELGPPGEGPTMVVQTTTEMGGDYELNKAVLDRMMRTIEFLGSID